MLTSVLKNIKQICQFFLPKKIISALRILRKNGIKHFFYLAKIKYHNLAVIHAWENRHELKIAPIAFNISNKVLKKQRKTCFSKKIKFSILVPVYNTPKAFIQEMLASVLLQSYTNWELCIADGSDNEHSYISEICRKLAKKDNRIKYKKLSTNKGISENTNECIKMSTGDYISLLDHDDLLHPSALYEIMKVVCNKDIDFVYTDEATFENSNLHKIICTNFKPDFSPDYFNSLNYICHFSSFKKSLLDKVGMFDPCTDGAQDFDLFLRIFEHTDKIFHIRKCLYYWRGSSTSTAFSSDAKQYSLTAGKKALLNHFSRIGVNVKISDSQFPNTFKVNYDISGMPLISILIPTSDHSATLKKCIDSITKLSTYQNYEIILIENNSHEEETFEYYEKLKHNPKIKIIEWKGKFNYSAINNFGFTHTKGDFIIFLNNDIEVISSNWIEEMLMFAQNKDIGAVGAKLYYPSDKIQHAGVIVGLGGFAGHSHKYYQRNCYGYIGRLISVQNYSAVTAACCMVPRFVFREINGFDENFEVAFNDVDMCMRIRKAGYRIVWTPFAELYHYESESRGYEDTPEKQARFLKEINRFKERWSKELLEGDPYYNPNLTYDAEDFKVIGDIFPNGK